MGGRPHRWHQLFPQRPAHLVPVAGDRRRRRTGHRRGLRPQPSRAVSRPAEPWRLAQRRSDPSAPRDDGQRGRDGRRHLASRHPGGLSAVSAGAAQRRRHVYPQRLRGVDERLGGGGPVDWLLRAAHEPVGRPAGAGVDARSGRRQQRFSGAGGDPARQSAAAGQPDALPAAEKDDPTTITLTLTGQAISDYVLYTVTITSFTDEPHQSVRPPTCGEPPMSGIIAFFRASPPKAGAAFDEHRFRRVRWQTFIAMTLAYVTFYVCRLSFTVAKSALVELGITPTELGMIGSTLFFSYAIGKLVNGFIADHANVVRYMSLGLLLSAGMNLMMGMTTNALLLAIFWGINGWAQSMGVGPCAVSLARWYGVKERGTFYGIWSTAHNIGEAVTYMVIAAVIAGFGWQMGYLSTAALGAAGVVLLVLFMHDSPQSSGFPSINVIRDEPQEEVEARGSVFKNQLLALRNPALWTLALASAFMYIDRYAVNSWGIFFLEQDKAYSTLEASGIIGVNAIAGIAGTIIAGMLSDRFFPRNRSVMAGFISLLNTAGFALMLWSPHNYYTDILAMIIFGATIGALTCFLGGLIAVDISSRKAAGAALGTIGIASYAGAGLGEFLTGIIIDKTAILENGKTLYDFSTLALFWVGTGLGSALLCFTTAAIVARRHAVERQTSFSS
ncbi:transporter, major facilitator family protein [Klebsiella pneumoniae subsp. pneumoniae DSM 30104 = JCM 1662 = NBRC 14940]|nr:transporter, major facilitator family protein [Klebsiella pneumoniae subsp. pneumoniae DSM 30104 = JCM 1662 = NBRC 14940]